MSDGCLGLRGASRPPNGPAEETVVDVDIDKVEAAAKMLGAAKNPMIVVGGGAQ